ncbi:vesicle coat complex COPII, subunit SFB3-like protein [Elysia marginata]|uniref:Vesicle coat complex COPII, subunit SFB3-like protein n=1 Tax=Elysia marginata TaxID=1093978 RepID=A0AAV4G070_9GAST|nr:vesicle coat complex COPII, subunit SFB3-like protein [Elysia marginata]
MQVTISSKGLGCLASCLVLLLTWAANGEAANIQHSRARRQANDVDNDFDNNFGNDFDNDFNNNFNNNFNRGRRVSCPQRFGQFELRGDCSRFIQCDEGTPSVQHCQPNLVFNAARGYCDFPANVPSCRPPQRGVTSSPSQEVNYDICSAAPNGGDPITGYQVAHPQICNAFYTCSSNYMYAPCTFCPEHMYFSLPERRCRKNTTGDFSAVCQGREYVSHEEKVHRQLDGMCRHTNRIPAHIFDRANSGIIPPGGARVVGVPYYQAHPILPVPGRVLYLGQA